MRTQRSTPRADGRRLSHRVRTGVVIGPVAGAAAAATAWIGLVESYERRTLAIRAQLFADPRRADPDIDDPAGLHDFLAALAARGAKDTAVSTFFSTHPGIEERLRDQERLLRAAPGGGRRNPERFARAVTGP